MTAVQSWRTTNSAGVPQHSATAQTYYLALLGSDSGVTYRSRPCSSCRLPCRALICHQRCCQQDTGGICRSPHIRPAGQQAVGEWVGGCLAVRGWAQHTTLSRDKGAYIPWSPEFVCRSHMSMHSAPPKKHLPCAPMSSRGTSLDLDPPEWCTLAGATDSYHSPGFTSDYMAVQEAALLQLTSSQELHWLLSLAPARLVIPAPQSLQ